MKKNWKNKIVRRPFILLSLVVISLLLLVQCTEQKTTQHDMYTCPMHPTVVADKQGTCPVCGMDLVRKARPGEEVKITEDLSNLIKSPNERVISSIKTTKAEFKSMPSTVKVFGRITYDSRLRFTIPARVAGRLEKVWVKHAFQKVSKGQQIAAIYSPELITAQQELLYALRHAEGDSLLLQSAKDKLLLLGASTAQLNAVVHQLKITDTFMLFSPYDGYVINEPAQPNNSLVPSSPPKNKMGDADMQQSTAALPELRTSSTLYTQEGNYVTAGQPLFTLVNTNALRVELSLPLLYAGQVTLNDEVTLMLEGKEQTGRIDFIQPFLEQGEEVLKLRVYLHQTHDLHIGELVETIIQLQPAETLWLPKEAVLDLGTDKIVFLKSEGSFKAKKISTGALSNGHLEIKQGLTTSDEVAVKAHYLIDSESFIKPIN